MYGNLSRLLGQGEMTGESAQLSLDDLPMPELQLDEFFLPPRPIARKLYDYMFDHSMVFVHFFHRPTFIKHFKMVYDYHFEQNGRGKEGDNNPTIKPSDFARFLPLLYASFAVGCVYAADDAEDIGIPDVHKAACCPLARNEILTADINTTLLRRNSSNHSTTPIYTPFKRCY